jgi:hypothetical protein
VGLATGPRQRLERVGLLEEGRILVSNDLPERGIVRIPGHEEESGAGPPGRESLRQLAAPHPGHDHIGEEEMDGTGVTRLEVEGLDAVRRLEHAIPLKLQELLGDPPHPRLVLDEQNGLRAARQLRARSGAGARQRLRQLDRGEMHPEQRSDPGLAPEGHGSPVSLRDAIESREPEARSPPGALGGEEGLEDTTSCRLVHAASLVLHLEHGVDPRALQIALPRRRLVERVAHEPDAQRSSPRHRLDRVHDEAQNGLLDLAPVRAHQSRLTAELPRHGHAVTREALDRAAEVDDQRAQVQDLDREHVVPAEREELAREHRAPRHGRTDLLGVPGRATLLGQRALEELALRENDREQVVEVVRHAAREHPHRLHLLRLAELLLAPSQGVLRAPSPGDVGGHPDDSLHRPLVVRAR